MPRTGQYFWGMCQSIKVVAIDAHNTVAALAEESASVVIEAKSRKLQNLGMVGLAAKTSLFQALSA